MGQLTTMYLRSLSRPASPQRVRSGESSEAGPKAPQTTRSTFRPLYCKGKNLVYIRLFRFLVLTKLL